MELRLPSIGGESCDQNLIRKRASRLIYAIIKDGCIMSKGYVKAIYVIKNCHKCLLMLFMGYLSKDVEIDYQIFLFKKKLEIIGTNFGVADGVGGWAAKGVDAGEYARQLMANAIIAVYEEHKLKGNVDLGESLAYSPYQLGNSD
ncbi:hypothetical protein QQP08_005196 [Theobroma cacao]|nr:hypothetical protein QQP08_005196 [Theobroma cacao]